MRTFRDGRTVCLVEDAHGRQVSPCRAAAAIDSRYRGGELHFRDKATGATVSDRQGRVYVAMDKKPGGPLLRWRKHHNPSALLRIAPTVSSSSAAEAIATTRRQCHAWFAWLWPVTTAIIRLPLRPTRFQGKLTETDAQRRTVILNYCEHFRAAYPTRDLDSCACSATRPLYRGQRVSYQAGRRPAGHAARVSFHQRTKQEYLARLAQVFAANKRIDVASPISIYRHPTMDGIYGVTLRQQYRNDRIPTTFLFLLWDFRNPSMPLIHVRTWQPAGTVHQIADIISLGDFNLE